MTGRIRTRVSLVVVLIDDFSNQVIRAEGFRVRIPGQKPPLHKPEGYYVFTNLPEARMEVLIDSGIYERQVVLVNLSVADPGRTYTLVKVRMVPGRAYALPAGTTCVEGRAEPGSRIQMFCRDSNKALKLLGDYNSRPEPEMEIGIYHPDHLDMEGKTLFIENRDGTNYEFFQIRQMLEEGGRYRPAMPLRHDYKKIGTTLYLVNTVNADDNGRFFLPLVNSGQEASECFWTVEAPAAPDPAATAAAVVSIDAAKLPLYSSRLVNGTVNRLNLSEEEC